MGVFLRRAAWAILFICLLSRDLSNYEVVHDSSHPNILLSKKTDTDTSTSIIVTSNLIPTHPSVAMINETIYSLYRHLIGLPKDVPLFLSIDGISKKDEANKTNHARLDQYIRNLRNASFPFQNITIIPAPKHLHIAGTVRQAMDHVKTKFVYVIQHDLPFFHYVYHSELIKAMSDHPTTLRNVLFKLEGAIGGFPICPVYNDKGVFPREEYQMLNFYATKRWSDNNHLTTKVYYDEMFANIDHLNGAMEWGMMAPAKANCSYWGQVVYGTREENYLKHLDGRRTSG